MICSSSSRQKLIQALLPVMESCPNYKVILLSLDLVTFFKRKWQTLKICCSLDYLGLSYQIAFKRGNVHFYTSWSSDDWGCSLSNFKHYLCFLCKHRGFPFPTSIIDYLQICSPLSHWLHLKSQISSFQGKLFLHDYQNYSPRLKNYSLCNKFQKANPNVF